MDECPSAYDLEAYSVGEGTPEVRAHIATCERCQSYLAQLGTEQQAFLQSEPADAFLSRPKIAAELNRPPESTKPRGRLWLAVFAPLAAAAALFLLVPSSKPGDIKLKGAEVSVVRLHHGTQTVESGTVPLALGDRIRVQVTVTEPGPITVGIWEDDGTWTVLADTPLDAGVHYLPKDEALAVESALVGWVIAAPSDEVQRALTEKRLEELSECRLEARAP